MLFLLAPVPPPAYTGPFNNSREVLVAFNPKSISWWHEQLVDWMFLNADQPLKAAAEHFNVSVTYIYMLKNSDSFKAYYSARRRARSEVLDDKAPEILGNLTEKTATVADMALDQILIGLERNAELMAAKGAVPTLSHEQLTATADQALKRLGYGIPTPGGGPGMAGQPAQTNVSVIIDASMLAAAREKMKLLHGVAPEVPAIAHSSQQEVTDVEPDRVGDTESGSGSERERDTVRVPSFNSAGLHG